jgi:hypothetical protein
MSTHFSSLYPRSIKIEDLAIFNLLEKPQVQGRGTSLVESAAWSQSSSYAYGHNTSTSIVTRSTTASIASGLPRQAFQQPTYQIKNLKTSWL